MKLNHDQQIWNLFTKREEYSFEKLDLHDRVTCSNSKHADVLQPKVSKFIIENGFEVEYPENKKFAVCLTHDVDDIYPPLKHRILSSFYDLKNLDLHGIKNHVFWKVFDKKRSPYLNFNEIMDIESKYDAKSSFYFITAENDPNRFRYDIEEIENEVVTIVDNGWEVGLHGGYYAYNCLDDILKEKKRLENVLHKEIIGYRNHYLRFKIPYSWELLADAGFKYDSTFGYSDMVGFRNGMCHPFKPYNLNENSFIDILEIPLVIMDGALFSHYNSFDEAWKCTKNLIDTVEKYSGVLTLLWHNHAFNCSFRKNWKLLYEKILKYTFYKNAWITDGEEIYNFFAHSKFGYQIYEDLLSPIDE